MEMSKGTIVHHFGSKDRLLEQVHSRYMRRRLDEAGAILEATEEPAEQLAALICHLMLVQELDRDGTVAFAREIVRFAQEPVMHDVRVMRNEYTGMVTAVLERGIKRGVFVPGDTHVLTMMIFGMCNWSWTWFRPDRGPSAEEVAGVYSRTVLAGLTHLESLPIAARRVSDIVHAAMAGSETRDLEALVQALS
jgi:AcrR family transcriptional regulator